MAMDAISSVGSTPAQQAQQAQTQVRAERPEPPPRPQAQPQPQQAEEPKRPPPVVNLQGQQTGTIINTSA